MDEMGLQESGSAMLATLGNRIFLLGDAKSFHTTAQDGGLDMCTRCTLIAPAEAPARLTGTKTPDLHEEGLEPHVGVMNRFSSLLQTRTWQNTAATVVGHRGPLSALTHRMAAVAAAAAAAASSTSPDGFSYHLSRMLPSPCFAPCCLVRQTDVFVLSRTGGDPARQCCCLASVARAGKQ